MATYPFVFFIENSTKKDPSTGKFLYPDIAKAAKKLDTTNLLMTARGPRRGGYICICDHCGKPTYSTAISKRFCNHECRIAFYQILKTGEIKPNPIPLVPGTKPKGVVTKTCECCGKKTRFEYFSITDGRGMACSRKCFDNLYILKSIKFKCNHCGTIFSAKSSRYAAFCCDECREVLPKLDADDQPIKYKPLLVNPEDLKRLRFNDRCIALYDKIIETKYSNLSYLDYPKMTDEMILPVVLQSVPIKERKKVD